MAPDPAQPYPAESHRAILRELMASNDLSEESRLYRATLAEFLTPTARDGIYRITANDDASEALVDIYEGGHICVAGQKGPGLAFAEAPDNEWCTSDRSCVEVCLRDVLEQGGLIYPVESVITSKVWFFTLPKGEVEVVSYRE